MRGFEEGMTCPKCLTGTLQYQEVEGCSCHINPPCHQCIDVELECSECGITESDIYEED